MRIDRPGDFGDEALVALAQKGEREAFETLIERYKQRAYRLAFDFTRDREEAKDLSQEAFLRAFTHVQRFDRQSSFYTWFYRILLNTCIDHHRRSKKLAWEPFEEGTEITGEGDSIAGTSSLPDREAMARELSQRIDAALASLPTKQRTAFILKNHQGLSIREIAQIMKAAEGTVKTHLHRAVTALRRSLNDFVQGGI